MRVDGSTNKVHSMLWEGVAGQKQAGKFCTHILLHAGMLHVSQCRKVFVLPFHVLS